MQLPKSYVETLKEMLGEDYPAYEESLNRKVVDGLRINTKKISVEEFLGKSDLPLSKIPWIENGFYCNNKDDFTKHPYYFAGLYYMQEASAMTPANRLNIEKNDRVLDLCAAPGGKSTQLGAALNDSGLLVANDISASRAKALLKNIELHGIGNAYVMSESPKSMEEYFEGYFDKILVDAPCSGEGMFHKEASMISYWQEHQPDTYVELQRSILQSAIKMLRPGGLLLYSTCTFSVLEDEENIEWVLEKYPQMEMEALKDYEGFSLGNSSLEEVKNYCRKLWPHKLLGEGHFLALLKKKEDSGNDKPLKEVENGIIYEKLPEEIKIFLKGVKKNFAGRHFLQAKDAWYLLPDTKLPRMPKIRFLRTGLFLGECKRGRFEPSQAFAMYLKRQEYINTLSLLPQDIRCSKYLKGETIFLTKQEENKEGYVLICLEDYPLGWGKISGNTIKNKYYKGWRMQ
ncbi:MAG TPA: RsmB/NOP family class I SAM-dependent RNA methyltransferase [Lachnospiraceae bacterium]